MPKPIKVFICYKRMLEKMENGEKVKSKNMEAGILNHALKQAGGIFEPWLDNSNLLGGMAWETEIYKRMLTSDVLLVLIGPGTSKSEWVSREIALATALGISVVPLGFDLSRSEMDEELKALDIDHLQGKVTKNITLDTEKALLEEIVEDLTMASDRTKTQQADVLSGLLARQKPVFTKAVDNKTYKSFKLKFGTNSVNLHIASGDLSEFQGIDVLVNSENNYMQMARFFEGRSVSSLLRRKGARVRDGKYEDTIQQELDWYFKVRGRPVQAGEVFITSAGGRTSELSETNEVKYIFHVASVEAIDSESRVVPYTKASDIRSFTRNCLGKLQSLNRLSGVISPPEESFNEQREFQKERAEKGQGISTSILFPLFGTGSGGAHAKDVIEPMLEGFSQYLGDPKNAELANVLQDIYISAFREDDVTELDRILTAKYG